MKNIIRLILFSSLLVGCSDTTTTDAPADQTSSESIATIESRELSKDSFEFTYGVDQSNISQADEENYVNIEGVSHEGKKIYVIYDGTVVDIIDIEDNGFFKYHSKSDEEMTRLVFSDDSNLTMGDNNLKSSDLENMKVVNVLPNKEYIAKKNEGPSSEKESESVEPKSNELQSSESIEAEESIESSEEETLETELPREYENALNNAYSYLDYTSFSKSGLYDQLIYEGYPEDAAQYAVDNVNTDWKENALQTAINYLEYTSFSDQGLYDQLIYEGYTSEQAQYAIDNLP